MFIPIEPNDEAGRASQRETNRYLLPIEIERIEHSLASNTGIAHAAFIQVIESGS